MNITKIIWFLLFITIFCYAQDRITFEKTFGGPNYDGFNSVIEVSDGNYICVGDTRSYGAGNWDVYLVKVDIYGNKIWEKTYGTELSESGYDVKETIDGGLIIVGYVFTLGINGQNDILLIKTDQYGNEFWRNRLGTNKNEYGKKILLNNDGGFSIYGSTNSTTNSMDAVYMVKTDSIGNKIWDKVYEEGGYSFGNSFDMTSEDGYIFNLATPTSSSIIKTDEFGNVLWQKYFDNNYLWIGDIQRTDKNTYILCGKQNNEFYLLEIDSSGTKLWDNTYNLYEYNEAWSVQQTNDRGYVTVGWTSDDNIDTDIYIIKTDSVGNKIWENTFGDDLSESAVSVIHTIADGYIIAGSKQTDFAPIIYYDAYLIKTFTPLELTIKFPNGGESWQVGSKKNIEWVAWTSNLNNKIKIEYTTNNGDTWTLISDSIDISSYLYEWIVPAIISSNYKIRITDITNPNLFDESDNVFSVYNPSVTLISPVGGEIIQGGSVFNITWDNNTEGNIKIEYSTNNGVDWLTIEEDIPANDESYSWIVPNTPSLSSKVRISNKLQPDISDESKNVFQIKPALYISEFENTFDKYDETSYSVMHLPDGGFILTGSVKTRFSDNKDLYIIRTDNSGRKIWEKIYGGDKDDEGRGIEISNDGGYVIIGTTNSFGKGQTDIYVLRIDSLGNKLWEKTLGDTGNDKGNSVCKTNDNYFMVAGTIEMPGYASQLYIIKIDVMGNIIWERNFGGQFSYDESKSIIQSRDGGFLAVGHSDGDVYIIKTDSEGNLLWEKTIDSTTEEGNDIIETTKGDILISGYTWPTKNNQNFYLIKMDPIGNKIWDKTYGGSQGENCYSLNVTADGSIILVGETWSFGAGQNAYIVVSDSSGEKIWDKTFGYSVGYSSYLTMDNAVIITGGTWGWTILSDVYLSKIILPNFQVPEIPQLQYPTDGANNINISTTFNWGNGSAKDFYHFQLSKIPSFNEIFREDSLLTSNNIFIDSMEFKTKYYWHLRTKLQEHWSDWSAIWSFTTEFPPDTSEERRIEELTYATAEPAGTSGGGVKDTMIVYFSDIATGAKIDSIIVALRQAGTLEGGIWNFNSNLYPIPLGNRIASFYVTSNYSPRPTSPYPVPWPVWEKIDLRSLSINAPTNFVVGFVMEKDYDGTSEGGTSVMLAISPNEDIHSYMYQNKPSQGDPGWRYFVDESSNKLEFLVRVYISYRVTDVDEIERLIPTSFSLYQNYPNPFNPSTTISYSLPKAANTKLIVYNILGQKIIELVNKYEQAGNYKVNFNPHDLPSGVYIYSLQAGEYHSQKKMIYLK